MLVVMMMVVMGLELLSFVGHFYQNLFLVSERIGSVLVGVVGMTIFLVVSVVLLSLFSHINIKMIILINRSKASMALCLRSP